MNVHEYMLQLDTVMSGQQGCTAPENPLKLGEMYLRVTQLRARKVMTSKRAMHLLQGAIHGHRRLWSWAVGNGRVIHRAEQQSLAAACDHAEEQ